jgi:ATP-binding cassette, subfamily B, bacterial
VPVVMFARRLRRQSRRTTDTMAEMSAMATEALGATKTIKSFVQEEEQSAHYGQRAEDSYQAEVSRLVTRATLLGGMSFLATSALVVLVWWGSKAVFDGVVTPGELTQFMLYALMASNALTNLSEVLGTLQTVAGATERLVEILDTEPGIQSPPNPVALPVPALGTVRFDKVSFAYGTRDDDPVIAELDFSVERGRTVALVGASGAGKSTIFALVQRFYDVTSRFWSMASTCGRSIRRNSAAASPMSSRSRPSLPARSPRTSASVGRVPASRNSRPRRRRRWCTTSC